MIFHANLSFFADDSKVYSVIKTIEDSHQLQADLDSIHEWCQVWLLKLNLSKCKIMHVRNSLIVTLYALSNGLGQHVHLDEVDHEKDPGVWFTSDLKPSLHCCKAAAAASAMKVLSMIRSFANISKKLYNFIFLYKTYIRPHLEYCVPIWSPYHVKILKS